MCVLANFIGSIEKHLPSTYQAVAWREALRAKNRFVTYSAKAKLCIPDATVFAFRASNFVCPDKHLASFHLLN